jgi:hypothetical protein
MPIDPESPICAADMGDAMVRQAEVAVYSRPAINEGKITLNCTHCGVRVAVEIKRKGKGGNPVAISSSIIGACPLRAERN